LYLSGYILEHKAGYYEGLQRVTTEAAWEPWVLYILNAVEQTARQTLVRIRAILDLIEQVRIRLQHERPRIYSKDLVELIFRAPYTKLSVLEDAGLAQRVTAAKYLRELVSLGVLEEHRVGKELYFLNLPFWRLLSGGGTDMFTP
jgi:Fic family protein